MKNQHVISHNGKWAVMSSGAQRVAKIFETQAEAKKTAMVTARKNHSELFIHGRDGRIVSRNSYGSDPYPPKDKK